ncbi:diacylglycerol kinase family protein [Marinilongibacter aquaticus]|uniref:diacylglycerol kinase family protein n=1 Tax=Marinilongibacter aquaticus TaxID=2975157 RepID=UPI0021BD4386|nr:diacylglycerol kinase family protein [Marinilongibacter aquaticus]UBM58018.1 diacylglycerol kinase family protein [Marinilongibacter aquaticus]
MLKSFTYARQGFVKLLRSENNFQFHFLAAILVTVAGLYFRLTALEWLAVFTAIALVFSAEAFNTAIEKLADRISTEREEALADIKDVAAAGVLIVAILALVIGLSIFGPKVFQLIMNKS